ncbi:MAG: hypothetical protein V3V01_15965 [Acidimicrobiales bacterium]
MTALVIVLGVIVLLLALLVAGLLRSHADILRALHQLGVSLDPAIETTAGASIDLRTKPGVAAPRALMSEPQDLTGMTPEGGTTRVAIVGSDSLTLLAFLSSGCQTCAGFWEAFGDPDRRNIDGLGAELVIVSKGPENESVASIRALAPSGVRTLMTNEAWLDYKVPASPYFILIDGGRVIGEGAAATWEQVSNLLRQAMVDAGVERSGKATKAMRRTGIEREARIDEELRRAGVEPGDPSLYPTSREPT